MRSTTSRATAAFLLTGAARAALVCAAFGAVAAAGDARAQSVGAVESGALRPLDAWEVGQVPEDEFALPATLWRNSDAAAIGPLMARLPGPFASPAATRLARAALMSPAATPPAGSEIAANDAAAKRFAALGRFGAADEIAAMAALAPAATADPNIVTYAAQADLARGRAADACRRAQGVKTNPQFILRLRAFCFASAGEQGASDLAAEVARSGGVNDPWLFSALPAVYGAGAGPTARFDTSLNAAVSIAGKLKPGVKPFVGASLLALDVVARTPDAAPALRAMAAQVAFGRYAISVGAARDALGSAVSLRSTRTAPLPSLTLALASVAAAKDVAGRARAIEAALKRSASWADYVATARLLKADMDALPKAPATSDAAAALARASLAAGDPRAAASWRDLIAEARKSPGEAYRAALDTAIAAAGVGGEATQRAAIERRLALGGAGGARDAALFGALGMPVPARAAAFIAAAPSPKGAKPIPPAQLAAIVAASQRSAQGETALLAAQALGPGAYTISRASLVSVVEALRAAGLTAQAREAAIEAMIGAGIG